MFKVNNKDTRTMSGVVLVSLLLTLNIFHILLGNNFDGSKPFQRSVYDKANDFDLFGSSNIHSDRVCFCFYNPK